jgi:hypothetical protein
MRYWDDLQSKWGFGDGDEVPPDARALRHVYVREINRVAAKLKSKVRLIAYDGCGMHNNARILRVSAELTKNVSELDLCSGGADDGFVPEGFDWDNVEDDNAMEKAIDHFLCGDNGDLDEMVEVNVRIRDKRARRLSA